jgi:hypothetical protein
MAAGQLIGRGYLGTLLRLTLLAPDIVEAILNGWQPADLEVATPKEPTPIGWHQQRCLKPWA